MNRGGALLVRSLTKQVQKPHIQLFSSTNTHLTIATRAASTTSTATATSSTSTASNTTISTSKSKYLTKATKRRARLATHFISSKETTSSTPPSLNVVVTHLTGLSGKQSKAIFNGPEGEQRLARFKNLHAALQNPTDIEPMWDAYQEIRRYRQDLELLSAEVIRLLTIHFKDSTKAAHPTFAMDKRALERKWASRIVTLFVDKREFHPSFSRWDSSDLMSALNRLERYEESLQEMDRLLSGDQGIDPILLNHAVRAWGGQGRLEKAMEVIEDARVRFRINPSEFTLGYLIQQLLLSHRRSDALSFWEELQAMPMESIQTANGLLRTCVKMQDSEFAQMVYDSLDKLHIDTSVETLDMMLRLAVADLQLTVDRTQFLAIVHDKITKSDRPVFDKRMLDSILLGFSKKGDMDGVLLVYKLMQRHGFPPNTRENNVILHGLARLGHMERAIDWFQQMRRDGIRPDRASYLILIQAYTLKRMPAEAEALFRQLIQDGIEPDLALCNSLLLVYEQGRLNRRCLHLYRNMFQDRIGLDRFSFSCMFNAVFHIDKATREERQGIYGLGSLLNNPGFIRKIGEPIGTSAQDYAEQRSITLENEVSDNAATAAVTTATTISPPCQIGNDSPSSLYPSHISVETQRQKFQFDHAISHTFNLEPRSLFRDMIIVGTAPSRTLFGNILRAFLSQNDFAGAAVALRTLLDYYILKPTPKMTAIVVSAVCQELERRNPAQRDSATTMGEMTKLVSGLGRTRGLIDILEKVATEPSAPDLVLSDLVEGENGAVIREAKAKNRRLRSRTGLQEENSDLIEVAKMQMGGDVVDLFSRGVPSGSSWTRTEDQPVQLDLKDFELWFKTYSSRRIKPCSQSN
ncbi:hypothetical protein BGZ94_006634 [Podila epigama]|nr:hypothetical protein BGZ94_006634 [Podila epigama]